VASATSQCNERGREFVGADGYLAGGSFDFAQDDSLIQTVTKNGEPKLPK